MQKSLQAQLIPHHLIGTRDALFHLLRAPKGEAIPQQPSQSRQVAAMKSDKTPKPAERDSSQSIQTDDFIFRD